MCQALAQLLGPCQTDIPLLMRDPGPSAWGHLRLWEHGGPGWGWVWIPECSQLQVRKGPWTMPPSLQEALAEASDGSPQKDRNGSSLFCNTLFHLDPEATLCLSCEAWWRRGPSASSWSNTPSSEPSPPYLTLSNSVPLPTEPAPSYPTGWLLHPQPKVSHGPPHRALSFSADYLKQIDIWQSSQTDVSESQFMVSSRTSATHNVLHM